MRKSVQTQPTKVAARVTAKKLKQEAARVAKQRAQLVKRMRKAEHAVARAVTHLWNELDALSEMAEEFTVSFDERQVREAHLSGRPAKTVKALNAAEDITEQVGELQDAVDALEFDTLHDLITEVR